MPHTNSIKLGGEFAYGILRLGSSHFFMCILSTVCHSIKLSDPACPGLSVYLALRVHQRRYVENRLITTFRSDFVPFKSHIAILDEMQIDDAATVLDCRPLVCVFVIIIKVAKLTFWRSRARQELRCQTIEFFTLNTLLVQILMADLALGLTHLARPMLPRRPSTQRVICSSRISSGKTADNDPCTSPLSRPRDHVGRFAVTEYLGEGPFAEILHSFCGSHCAKSTFIKVCHPDGYCD